MIAELIIVAGGLISTGGLAWFITSYTKKIKDSEAKISDANLLRTIANLGNFTTTDLTRQTNLTKSEAYWRIQKLSLSGAIKTFYDASGMPEMYSLKENIDLQLINPITHEITENDIIYIAQQNNGVITPTQLCLIANMSLEDAKKQIKHFKRAGLIVSHYNQNFERIYTINHKLKKIDVSQTSLLTNNTQNSLRDSAVIQLAIEMNGKLTTTSLCLRKDISIEQAQKVLDELHNKSVFEIKVSNNGVLEYWLVDENLLLN